MDLLFHALPKVLFIPVYVAGWIGCLWLIAASAQRLRNTHGKSRKSFLIFAFLLITAGLSTLHLQSTRYIFLLAFPFTFFAAIFVTRAADRFPRHAEALLIAFTLMIMVGNALKVLHVDRCANFSAVAAEKLIPLLSEKRNVLLTGDSKDIGLIAHQAGIPYYSYRYPIENAEDLMSVKNHFCDHYQVLILVSENEIRGDLLPPPLFSVPKSKQGKMLFFYKIELSSSPMPNAAVTEKNLFINADLEQPISAGAKERIRIFFSDNPEVLKIVDQPGFFWPAAWPFDHAGKDFPRRDFMLSAERNAQGKRTIHLKCRSPLPFYQPVAFSMNKNYRFGMTIHFFADSEIAINQLLKAPNGRILAFDEIKSIAGKAGELRTVSAMISPGKLQRVCQSDRQNGTVIFSFVVKYGDLSLGDFILQEK